MIFFLCFVLVGIFLAVNLLWKYKTRKWRNFATVPLTEYPLLGHVPGLLSMSEPEYCKLHQIWLKKTKTLLMWIGFRHILMTTDIKVFEKVLSSPKLIKKSSSYWIFNDWLGQSLLTSNGLFWQKRRKLLTPSFHFNIMADSSRIIENHCKNLVTFLQVHGNSENGIKTFELMKIHSIGIIFEAAFGSQTNLMDCNLNNGLGDGENKEVLCFIKNIDRLLQLLMMRDENPFYWWHSTFKWFPEGIEYFQKLKMIEEFNLKAIQERIDLLKDSDLSGKNKDSIFIDRMIDSHLKGELEIQDILNEAQTFLFAGYDTIATALGWCMYMLGSHPEIQKKAFEEAQKIKDMNLPIQEALKEMKYMECVIKETLRIHPSAPMISREMEEEVEIDSVVYPKGSAITLCILAMHRDSSIWEEPLQFKPERFLGGIGNDKSRSAYSFVPFSAGPRNCIGQRFAMMELKITLYHLLLDFEIVALQKPEELEEVVIVVHHIRNEDGLKVVYRPRKKNL